MKKNQKNGYVVVEKALVGHSPELTGVSPDMNEEDLALLGFGVFPSQGLAEAKIETAFPKRKQSLFGVASVVVRQDKALSKAILEQCRMIRANQDMLAKIRWDANLKARFTKKHASEMADAMDSIEISLCKIEAEYGA